MHRHRGFFRFLFLIFLKDILRVKWTMAQGAMFHSFSHTAGPSSVQVVDWRCSVQVCGSQPNWIQITCDCLHMNFTSKLFLIFLPFLEWSSLGWHLPSSSSLLKSYVYQLEFICIGLIPPFLEISTPDVGPPCPQKPHTSTSPITFFLDAQNQVVRSSRSRRYDNINHIHSN